MKSPVTKYALAIALAVVLVYGQVYSHEFIDFDDNQYLFDNPRVRSGLSLENIRWAMTTDHGANWHPVTWISLMIDCELFGLNPRATHLMNVGFHAANALLLLLLLVRLTGEAGPSAFVAALFALHPIHIESVAWATERKDVLSTFFWFLTMHKYLSWARAPTSPRYVGMAALFALGLMTKAMLVTLPFTLLLIDFWPLGRLEFTARSIGGRLLEKIPLFLLVAGSCAMTILFEHRGAGMPLTTLPIEWRIGNAFVSYILYIRNFLWPAELALVYPHPMKELSVPIALLSAALVSLITIVALAQFRRRPFIAVGWLWYLGTLVPVIGIVQVGVQSMADRYAYVPFIGLYVLVAWSASKIPPGARLVTAVMLIAVLSFASFRHVAIWADSERLFGRAVEVTKGNWLMENALGSALMRKGRVDDALHHFERAVRVLPEVPMIRANLGRIYHRKGKYDEAEAQFRHALAMDSVYADAHNGLGLALLEEGRLDEAMAHFSEASRLEPDNARSSAFLGKVLLRKGRFEEAEQVLRASIRADPFKADPYGSLAYVMAKRGRLDDAIGLFEKALAIDTSAVDVRHNYSLALASRGDASRGDFSRGDASRSDHRRAILELRLILAMDSSAHNSANDLAWLLATTPDTSQRDGAEALRLARSVSAGAGDTEPRFLDTVAAAYAANGDFREAEAWGLRAIALAESFGDSDFVAGARARVESYRIHESIIR